MLKWMFEYRCVSLGCDIFFFFQAEDGIRDLTVTGVQTCALPISGIDIFLANAGIEGVLQPITDYPLEVFDQVMAVNVRAVWLGLKYVIPVMRAREIGRASCRERV